MISGPYFAVAISGSKLSAPPEISAPLVSAATNDKITGITFAAETLSITTMEIVDNLVVLAVPGAMDAGLGDVLFWGSLALSLALAFVAAFPVNRWLIGRGMGHAIMHGAHS